MKHGFRLESLTKSCLDPRFAGNAGVSPAEHLNSPVLAFGMAAFCIHNIAYRFRWKRCFGAFFRRDA